MFDPGAVILWGLMAMLDTSVTVSDLRQFPSKETAAQYRDTAKLACEMARSRESVFPAQASWWWEARCEASLAAEAWDLLYRARTNDSERDQLEILERLRDVVGWKRYYSGVMPCPVPLRYFPSVD